MRKEITALDNFIFPVYSENYEGIVHIAMSFDDNDNKYKVKSNLVLSERNKEVKDKSELINSNKVSQDVGNIGDLNEELKYKLVDAVLNVSESFEESKTGIFDDIKIDEQLVVSPVFYTSTVINELDLDNNKGDGISVNSGSGHLNQLKEYKRVLEKKMGVFESLKKAFGIDKNKTSGQLSVKDLKKRPPQEVIDRLQNVLKNIDPDKDPADAIKEALSDYADDVHVHVIKDDDDTKEFEKDLEERVEQSNSLNKMFDKYTPEQIRAILPEDLGPMKVKYGEQTVDKFISELTKRENAKENK